MSVSPPAASSLPSRDVEAGAASFTGLQAVKARRSSPKLSPHTGARTSAPASSHTNGAGGGGGGAGHHPRGLPLLGGASTAAATSASASGLRVLLSLLAVAGCLALLSVVLDHAAFTRHPAVVCTDAQTCATAALSHSRTAQSRVVASPTIAPLVPPPASTPSSPPFYDSLASLLACPPLASILGANGLLLAQSGDSAARRIDVTAEPLKAALSSYERALAQRLSASSLHFWDWQTQPAPGATAPLRMAELLAAQPTLNFSTRSARNVDYSISQWERVCLTLGGAKDPHLVLVGADTAALQRLVDEELLKQPHSAFGWLPFRYCNDQVQLRVQARPDDDWLWLPAGDGEAAFHQLEWDFNIGHQFHQQVLPMYTALTAHALFQRPAPSALLIDGGCAEAASTVGVRHGAWKPINQLLARIAVEGVKDRVRVLRQDCSAGGRQVGVCFERLLLNDPSDQYLDRGPGDASFESFRRYRALILRSLGLQPPPFPASAAGSATAAPLRVTIYSRQDSARRRILNVDAIVAALAPHHIVRHVPDFGSRPAHEQLALYAHTDVLIAPHGAHMTYAFLLPEHAVVVEAFAHDEGRFSWTVNFLKATRHRHFQQTAIADFPGHTPLERLEKGSRHMDRDFHLNLSTLCTQLRSIHVPIAYQC